MKRFVTLVCEGRYTNKVYLLTYLLTLDLEGLLYKFDPPFFSCNDIIYGSFSLFVYLRICCECFCEQKLQCNQYCDVEQQAQYEKVWILGKFSFMTENI